MKNLITAGALALALATTASLTLTTAAIAGESGAVYKAGDVTIVSPWARATAGKPRNGGAYLTIKGGTGNDELTGVESDVAKKTQLHGHRHEKGVMKMHRVSGIKIPAGAMVMLKPGGHHVMLMKLKHALKEGGGFPLTLHFAKAGKVTVEVQIKGVGAMNAGTHAGHGKMKMKK